MKAINLSDVKEAGQGQQLPAGGYVCKITNVEDVPEKEYLYVEFDIAEGEHKGYFKELEERANFWGGMITSPSRKKTLTKPRKNSRALSVRCRP